MSPSQLRLIKELYKLKYWLFRIKVELFISCAQIDKQFSRNGQEEGHAETQRRKEKRSSMRTVAAAKADRKYEVTL
jgi:hypothetical protein